MKDDFTRKTCCGATFGHTTMCVHYETAQLAKKARDINTEYEKIVEAAREFVWDAETWEGYEQCKGSTSAALPVYFLALCELIEDTFGPPPVDDEN